MRNKRPMITNKNSPAKSSISKYVDYEHSSHITTKCQIAIKKRLEKGKDCEV